MNRFLRRALCALVIIMTVFAASAPAAFFASAESENLSVGKTYGISYESPIDNAFPNKKYRAEKKLTDGIFASQKSYADKALATFYRGTVLYVTIDLENVCAVDRVEVHALHQKAAGIYCPRYGSVAVSEDGENFGTVASFDNSALVRSSVVDFVTADVKLPEPYRARYVRVALASDVFLYMDEITVYGSKDPASAKSAGADKKAEDAGIAKPVDGIGNICLMYTVGNYSEKELLPYFAYVDAEGNPVDTMYDGMLFLPSGASNYDFTSPSGWDRYIEEMFGEISGMNLTALDRVVAKYASQIGLPADYRYPVFLAIPKLPDSVEEFTEFDELTPFNLDSKLTIIQGYMNKMIGLMSGDAFKSLELKGFYWHEEQIPYSELSYAEDLMKGFTSYVHEKGLFALWIPYYCAPGFERGKELGFDGPCLQAGYAFDHSQSETGDSKAAACDDSAAQAKKFGLGLEFELDLSVKDFYKRFFKYVHTAYKTGCMTDGLMTMYQGVTDIYKCAGAASGTDMRNVYEMLHEYIHDSFVSEQPVIQPGQFIAAPTGERTSGNLTVTDTDSKKNALKIRNSTVQDGLTAVFEGDGFYLINTKETVPGAYSVRLTVTDGYNDSEEEEVIVLVYDPAGEKQSLTLKNDVSVYKSFVKENPESASKGETLEVLPVKDGWYCLFKDGKPAGLALSENLGIQTPSEPGSQSPSSLLPLWISLGAVAAVAAVVAACLIIRKKKKKE